MRSLLLALLFIVVCSGAHAQQAQNGIALHGSPKYPADFQHFDYVNPDAPKGGEIRLAALGTYDSLNPFILKGVPAEGASMVFETLMTSDLDEPFSQYGWIAESVTVAPDRGWVSYKLRLEAKFQDGSPITPEDVIFSFEILRDKGLPYFRSYYKDVASAEKIGPHEVKFIFSDKTNTELPLIMGQLPVLSKKFWQGKDFAATTLTPILGSGPYKVSDISPGRSIAYERVKDWWAKDLPINRGRFNFDTIRFDYYRDPTVMLEGFFAGRYDIRFEDTAKYWALSYDTPAVQQGLIKKDKIRNYLPQGMQGFVFNMRRPLFQDRRVREALGYALDFEWLNKNVAYGAYSRLGSYFENSELAGHGLPSPAELKLLEPYKDQLPPEVFTQEYKPPVSDGSGENRENLRKAADLLRQAGWTLKDGKLVDAQGKPFSFEIIDSTDRFERWIEPFIRNLERLGVEARFRVVDTSQMQNLVDDFNFDMIITTFPQSLSPGNEERALFSSSKADVRGSRNLIGVKNPVVDALLEKLVHAESREDLVAATRALDRVLAWNYYVIPHWYIDSFRVAYWDMFGRPKNPPPYGLDAVEDWWIDPAKAPKIMDNQRRNR